TDFFGFADIANAVTVQPDGKIVAAGAAATNTAASVSFNFAVARYNSNGTLDTTFGAGGKVATDFAGRSYSARALVVSSHGKILVAGGATTSDLAGNNFALARYNSNGSPDTSFGTGGKLVTTFAGGNSGAGDVAIQADGKIVAAGTASINDAGQFALARYL